LVPDGTILYPRPPSEIHPRLSAPFADAKNVRDAESDQFVREMRGFIEHREFSLTNVDVDGKTVINHVGPTIAIALGRLGPTSRVTGPCH